MTPLQVHQLLCAMRGAPGAACFEVWRPPPHPRTLCTLCTPLRPLHPPHPPQVARLAAATRSGALGGVVGLDLAGDEYHFNNSVGDVLCSPRRRKP